MTTWSGARANIRTPGDAAEQIAANPPDIPGWAWIGTGELLDATTVRFLYEDDDGTTAWVTLTITEVEVHETPEPREPREREKGDDL